MIGPTVGRIVHYYPSVGDNIARVEGQPLAAIVAFVHNDRMINIGAFDANGAHQPRCLIRLLQDDEQANVGESYCAWMPYQLGQAAKTEAALAQPA
jgi:hypothetical protein